MTKDKRPNLDDASLPILNLDSYKRFVDKILTVINKIRDHGGQ